MGTPGYTVLQFIKRNIIWIIIGIILLILLILALIFGIVWGDVHDFDRLIIFDKDDIENCVNGEFCGFCSKKCICEFGWKGENCDMLINDTVFYPMNWWNMDSMECVNQGNLMEFECRSTCASDPECKAYTWNPCDSELPSCCSTPDWPCPETRRKINNGPTCCYGTGPNPSCCVPQCKHIKNFNGYTRPFFINSYERTGDPFPTRRNIESEHILLSQQFLYIKNGVKCFGYLCTYNDEYGLVFVDDIVYLNIVNTMNEIIEDGLEFWNIFGNWQDLIPDTMENYDVLPSSLGNVLEITELPFLQMKRIFNTTSPSISSMTVASSRGIMYSMILNTDYNYEYDGHTLEIIDKDYSLEFLDPNTITEKYNTIILIMPLYMRKSLPKLLTNSFNLLKDGGRIIIRGQNWDFINSTVIINWCMAAGMAKNKFTSEYFDLFKELHFEEDLALKEPCEGVCEDPSPFPFKNTECWSWFDVFYHPNHMGKWFSFIGKK